MNVLSRLLLLRPAVIEARLEALRSAGVEAPNVWQITLGVLRMWHRVFFRSETIGTCVGGVVRPNWRARWMHNRVLRFPMLLKEKAITPLDFSGLLSSPARLRSHLLGAHHDRNMFAYDLELLSFAPGELQLLAQEVAQLLSVDTPRARWMRDLVVYEGYHERLRDAVQRALAGDFGLTSAERSDPDVSFGAYFRWCLRQPATPGETLEAWRAGRFSIAQGVGA
jgi:hypothetical protein